MPRLKREIIPGFPYHVTQRGIRRTDVFYSIEDRLRYLERFNELTLQHGVEVLAYCLMTTHVHHIVVPKYKDSLERVFRPLHSEHANRINLVHDWKGHLFQNRFFSCLLDGDHLEAAIRYVEINPVRAKMAELAEDYRWSSARARVNGEIDRIITADPLWESRISGITRDWSSWLKQGLTVRELEFLRKKTSQGLPCASDGRVKELEKQYGIRLSHKTAGRPRNSIIIDLGD